MGVTALVKGEIQFSRNKTLTRMQAKIAGVSTIALGLAIIAFSVLILIYFDR